jgi:hypothetical protein
MHGDRVSQVRVLRAPGGLHRGVHRRREGRVRRAVALRAVLGGGQGRGGQGPEEEEERLQRGPGGGRQGPHVLLRQVRKQPGLPRRRRHAPDASPALQRHLHLLRRVLMIDVDIYRRRRRSLLCAGSEELIEEAGDDRAIFGAAA